jgi:phage terminase small subunit
MNQLTEIRITPKQRKFAEALIRYDGEKSATECAIMAGYPKKSARVVASRLQSIKVFPKVANYISLLREEVHKKYMTNLTRHMRRLDSLSKSAESEKNFSAAVNAEMARGRAAGLYVDRKEILTGSIDRMSKIEVEDKLKELRSRFPEVIVDVSHETTESED